MAKTKKSVTHRASRSRSFTALLVVGLTVVVGGLSLPSIFADTAAVTASVSDVGAVPTSDDSYAVRVTWSGQTNGHWKGQTVGNGTTQSWTSPDRNIKFSGLKCDVRYTFRVAAVKAGGGTTAYKDAQATPPCPKVVWSGYSTQGNNVYMSWAATSGFSSTYNLYIKTGGGAYVLNQTRGTSWTISGACNTTYTAYATASAGGQTGPASITRSVTTAACPVPQTPTPSTPTPSTPTPTPSTPNSGGTKPSTNKPSTSSNTNKTSGGTQQSAPTVPGTPGSFAADVVSHKVVVLSWDAVNGADHYLLTRSSDDGLTWQEIANNVKELTYTDSDTEFSAMYRYRIKAVNGAGESPEANVQANTEAFTASSSTITSDDKLVSVTIPDGAIEGEYSCSIGGDDVSASELPADKHVLIGPDMITCVNNEGVVIDTFKKPLQYTLKLASVVEGYGNVTIGTFKNDQWKTIESSYSEETRQATFTLDDDIAFAAFGEKQGSSVWGIVITVLLLLALIGGALAAYFLWWRNRSGDDYYPIDIPAAPAAPAAPHAAPTLSQAAQAELDAEQEFRQALAQPDCSHLAMAQQVTPTGTGCLECEQLHTKWKSLRICLTCGHVGCSDDSPQQHALKHYQETGHPLIYEYGNPNGNTIGWCYIDQTYI